MGRVAKQVGSLLLACNVRLHYRWVPSEWNPADNPSRGRGGPSSLRPLDLAVSGAVGANVASPPGGAARRAEPPWRREARHGPVSSAGDEPFGPMYLAAPCQGQGPSGGQHGSERRERLRGRAEASHSAKGTEWDLLREDNQRRLLDWVATRRLLGVVMTPPTKFWRDDGGSHKAGSRDGAAPSRVREAVNVMLVKFMCKLARECRGHGIPWAILVPRSSTLLRGPRAHRLLEIRDTRYIANDACMWGGQSASALGGLVLGHRK